MSREGNPRPADDEVVARAHADLQRTRRRRQIAQALAAGDQPTTIADEVGISLQEVQRVERRIRAGIDHGVVGPEEIINLKIIGEIGEDEMMRRLTETTYTAGMYDPTGGDGYRHGTWDDVQSAARLRLLTEEQYNWLLQHAEIRPPAP